MKYDWRNELKWERNGSISTGRSGFPLVIHRAKLGKDKNGRTWLVECEPLMIYEKNKFRLRFDTDEETENSFPFLRSEVLEAEDFTQAQREIYRMKEVPYKDILKTIEKVTEEIGII